MPTCKVCSLKLKDHRSTFCREHSKHLRGFKKGFTPWNKGKQGLMPTPWNKGRAWDEETKMKISISRKGKCTGENNPRAMQGKDPWNKGRVGVYSKETIDKIRSARLQQPCPTLGKKWKVSEDALENIRKATQRGAQHHCWIQDRSLLKESEKKHLDSRYKEWLLAVKNRDGWKCKISNGDCSGRLGAHHILRWSEYPELRYKINNGITLCHAHHPRKRAEEKRLQAEFQQLVVAVSEVLT